MRRILVTGSRDWADADVIEEAIIQACRDGYDRRVVIVHGKCPTGADFLADNIARARGIDREAHPAIWRPNGIYNPQAGLLRNRKMVNLGACVCLAFIRNGSRGASHCARLAEEAGIPTRRYTA